MKKEKEKLVAVVVTYNRVEKLKKSLSRLIDSDIDEIVVVNNHSSDKTAEYLSSLDSSKLHVIDLEENLGGSGGFYYGVKYTHETIVDYDWILLCDDDAYIEAGTIDHFLQRERRDDIFAYMSAVYYPSGEVCDMNVPGFEPFKSFSQAKETLLKDFHIESVAYRSNQLIKVDFASFVGIFVKKDAISTIGYPDPKWFIYGDDLDFTLNMTKHNLPIYFDPNLKFIHDCETIDKNKRVYSPMWKAYFTYRNGLIIYKRLSGKLFPLIVFAKVAKWLSNVRFYEDKKGYLKLLSLAVKDGLKGDRDKKLKDLKRFIDV